MKKKFLALVIALVIISAIFSFGACDNMVNVGRVYERAEWESDEAMIHKYNFDRIQNEWMANKRVDGGLNYFESNFQNIATIVCDVKKNLISESNILKAVCLIVTAEEDCVMNFALYAQNGEHKPTSVNHLQQKEVQLKKNEQTLVTFPIEMKMSEWIKSSNRPYFTIATIKWTKNIEGEPIDKETEWLFDGVSFKREYVTPAINWKLEKLQLVIDKVQ